MTKSFFVQHSPTARREVTDREALNKYLKKKGLSEDDEIFTRHMYMSRDGDYIYHVSIIDYMQLWNFDKKSEQFAKKWFLGKDGKQISAVEPKYY